MTMFNLDYETIDSQDTKEKPLEGLFKDLDKDITPRDLMTTLGTEWGRNMIHKDIWLAVAKIRILNELKKGRNIVISDIRYDNEAKLIHELGGHIVEIVRPYKEEKVNFLESLKKYFKKQHTSEQGINDSNIDFLIRNYGSIEELSGKAKNLTLHIFNL